MKLYCAFSSITLGQTQNTMNTSSSLTINRNTFPIDSPFVTIILPLDYENEITPYHVLEELIAEVKNQLTEMRDSEAFKVVLKKLNRLIVKLPPQNVYKGFVAFLSEDVEDLIPVNYEVKKKAIVSENFDFEEIQLLSGGVQSNAEVSKDESSLKYEIFKRLVEFRPFGKKTY
jgi:hypothetical protein